MMTISCLCTAKCTDCDRLQANASVALALACMKHRKVWDDAQALTAMSR